MPTGGPSSRRARSASSAPERAGRPQASIAATRSASISTLTKAILRAGGAKAKHDEDAIYSREVAALREEPPVPATGVDWISFTVAFKGVLLEGLEVAFIVVSFGSSAGMLGPATLGAAIAGVLVLVVAIFVRGPLARVPENGLKFAVGVMLVGFGTFWAGEGVGVDWPGEDATIILILAAYLALSLVAVRLVRARLATRGISAGASAAAGR